MKPFSVGPRNCVGQGLAWAEIRGVLARLVWDFKIEAVVEREEEGGIWGMKKTGAGKVEVEGWGGERQKVHTLWQKERLMVMLRSRGI